MKSRKFKFRMWENTWLVRLVKWAHALSPTVSDPFRDLCSLSHPFHMFILYHWHEYNHITSTVTRCHLLLLLSLLLVASVAYHEHREPWCNDVDRGKLPIRPPECSLAILPAESSSGKLGGFGWRKLWILSTKYFFHCRSSLTCRKILRH
jgi:hypothetical protein